MKDRSQLMIIFLIVFFDLLSFGVVIPILPYYAKSFGADAFVWSWVMAIYSIMQFLFAPFWGSLSDKHGRRPILLLSVFCGAVSMAALGFAGSVLWIFLCRMFAGIFAANISTATAYVSDITTPENRAKGMGIIGASFGLGFIFGPAIGGLLAPLGYHVPVLFAAGLGFANFILACFILSEPLRDRASRALNRRRYSLAVIKEALSERETALPVILFFLSTLAFTQLEVSFGFFVLDRYGYDAKEAGYMLAGMGLVMALIQGGAIGRLAKRFGERRLALTGFCLMALALIGAALPVSVPLFVVFILFIAVGHALINPSLSSLMSMGAPPDRVGGMMGVYQSASSLGRIVGPPVAGVLYVDAGMTWPLWSASGILFAGLIIGMLRLPSRKVLTAAT